MMLELANTSLNLSSSKVIDFDRCFGTKKSSLKVDGEVCGKHSPLLGGTNPALIIGWRGIITGSTAVGRYIFCFTLSICGNSSLFVSFSGDGIETRLV